MARLGFNSRHDPHRAAVFTWFRAAHLHSVERLDREEGLRGGPALLVVPMVSRFWHRKRYGTKVGRELVARTSKVVLEWQ